jgi:hypothetical protein
MATNYAYKYAQLMSDGLCIGLQDTSDYFLDPLYIPIEDDSIDYLLKYYHPIPETVNSFADFQGLFYLDAAHTQPFEEGNAALRHED